MKDEHHTIRIQVHLWLRQRTPPPLSYSRKNDERAPGEDTGYKTERTGHRDEAAYQQLQTYHDPPSANSQMPAREMTGIVLTLQEKRLCKVR